MNYEREELNEKELEYRKRLLKKSMPSILIITIAMVFGTRYFVDYPLYIALSILAYFFIIFRIFMYYMKH